MKLSIIIPVYNEEKTIGKILSKISSIKLPKCEKEIVVINDGSTDATASVISNFKFQISNFKIIKHKKNQGKGAAVKTGIENATGDYILVQDADLEYEPNDIFYLLQPIFEKKALVVYGTRLRRMPHLKKEERTFRFLIHYFGNRFLSFLTSILYGQWITDMETGYKIFPKKAVENMILRSKSFEIEPELTAKLLKKGYPIFEVSIKTNPRGYDEGKKLHTVRDGLLALWTLMRYRFID